MTNTSNKARRFDVVNIMSDAHMLAGIYNRQPRDWDMVAMRPRSSPLPAKPYTEYFKAGLKQAWANARLEIKHRDAGDQRGPWPTPGYRLTLH